MHNTTFEYLNPTEAQKKAMGRVRSAFAVLAQHLDDELPNGSDKTYVIRKLRTVAMWANVAITRQPDGAPRTDE